MKVLIFDNAGKLISRQSVAVGGMNYQTEEEDFFDAAWDAAVGDGLVDPDLRSDYSFQMAD
jgi:hypothetical protein